MGVEKFFSSLKKKYKSENDIFITQYNKPIKCNHLLIDFNSIVHVISQDLNQNSNHSNNNTFELELIKKVCEYIENLIRYYMIVSGINSIHICVDGIPTMAKIYEQKKRRYMGDLLSNLAQHSNSFTWSRNNISPGTDFMKDMINALNSEEYIKRIKNICINIKEYNVSGILIEGEGEFKIVKIIDTIISNNNNNNIIVYSPDSDVILLLLLSAIKNPTFKITMLRFDQMNSRKDNMIYDVININHFQNILIDYIKTKDSLHHALHDIKHDHNLIADIVFILTVFGDDFLPKLETVRVNMDISIILDFYALILGKYNYILTKKNNIYMINTNTLLEFFKLINNYEDYFIKRNAKHHMISSYHKIEKYILSDSLYKLRDLAINYIWKFIYINKVSDVMVSPLNVNTLISVDKFIEYIKTKEVNIDKKILEKFINKDINSGSIYNCYDSMLYLIKYNYIEILQNIDNISISTPENVLQSILVYFYINYKLPFNFNIELYHKKIHLNTFNSNDMNHRYRIEKMDKSKINNYLIENKLDQYFNLFNPVDNFYKNVYKHIESEIDYNFYYTEHFPNINKDTLVSNYIEGLNFVLNYYHNHIVDNYWYYPHSRSPMLSDIIKFYTSTSTSTNKLDTKFLTPLEHYIFVTPFHLMTLDSLNMISKNNKNNIDNIILFIKENPHYFFNLDKIYKNLYNKSHGNKQIDCSVSHFISKCHLIYLEKYIDIKKFIIDIRKYIK